MVQKLSNFPYLNMDFSSRKMICCTNFILQNSSSFNTVNFLYFRAICCKKFVLVMNFEGIIH